MANLTLGVKKVDRFVKQQVELGNDVRWDGWDLVFFRPADAGIYNKAGAFRNGTWGFDNRVSVNENGVWEVDFRNVKRSRNSGTRR